MGNSHPKSIDGLMRYLRDNKGIAISGSIQKRRLMNIGYYHGFKGYRYIGTPSNSITYIKFEELNHCFIRRLCSLKQHLKIMFLIR